MPEINLVPEKFSINENSRNFPKEAIERGLAPDFLSLSFPSSNSNQYSKEDEEEEPEQPGPNPLRHKKLTKLVWMNITAPVTFQVAKLIIYPKHFFHKLNFLVHCKILYSLFTTLL